MKLAVDLVIRRGDDLLFIRRKFPPFAGELALPGGFVEEHETCEQAACRELLEETGVTLAPSDLKLVGVFSAIKRDPRGRVVSIAYSCNVPSGTEARAGDDAADAVWRPLAEIEPHELAFDHGFILEHA